PWRSPRGHAPPSRPHTRAAGLAPGGLRPFGSLAIPGGPMALRPTLSGGLPLSRNPVAVFRGSGSTHGLGTAETGPADAMRGEAGRGYYVRPLRLGCLAGKDLVSGRRPMASPARTLDSRQRWTAFPRLSTQRGRRFFNPPVKEAFPGPGGRKGLRRR